MAISYEDAVALHGSREQVDKIIVSKLRAMADAIEQNRYYVMHCMMEDSEPKIYASSRLMESITLTLTDVWGG